MLPLVPDGDAAHLNSIKRMTLKSIDGLYTVYRIHYDVVVFGACHCLQDWRPECRHVIIIVSGSSSVDVGILLLAFEICTAIIYNSIRIMRFRLVG